MLKHLTNLFKAACLACVLVTAIIGVGQTITPPIAEYRGKAQGMFELRNDGDAPLTAIVEVQGFAVDEEGTLKYQALDPDVRVELGANSFVIPPHQSHMVFYKASTTKSHAWFSILSTLTRAARDRNQMRINFVLPHVVYIYQKQKLKKADLNLSVSPAEHAGEYRLEVHNQSDKLGRVENVSWRGFEKSSESGGFPIFPGATRRVTLPTGTRSGDAKVKVTFEDGFSFEIPVQ